MRNLILVAVILQLAIIIIGINGYEFGDIISFRRRGLTFKHFAVYVGDKELEGKTAGQDIFHRIGLDDNAPNPDCVFGVLANEIGEPHVENYLDKAKTFSGKIIKRGSDDEISARIKAMMEAENCKTYRLGFNNCEHLATAVRYGYKVTKQKGTVAAAVCWWNKPKECIKLNKQVEEMLNRRQPGCEPYNG